jgi:hypothetical protein
MSMLLNWQLAAENIESQLNVFGVGDFGCQWGSTAATSLREEVSHPISSLPKTAMLR